MSDPATDEPVELPALDSPLKLAVGVSGGGTTLQNLVHSIRSGELDAEIRLVIASGATCGAIGRADAAGVRSEVLDAADFGSPEAYGHAVFTACEQAGADLVLLAGFLKRVAVPKAWRFRTLNIHPSLIPAFSGQGYYGRRVHQAAIDRGVKVTGCTVHFVDDDYDHGPIIMQRCVPVLSDDTADTLAARVFEQECQLYPQAIRLVASGRLSVAGRRVLEATG